MSVQQLPSRRWRAQVYDQATGKNISVSKVLGGAGTFKTKTEAKTARSDARKLLGAARPDVTVADFRARWITDPLFARPKESTNIHNAERTNAFARTYGSVPIDRVSDEIVAEWVAGGKRNATVPALRAMFNDAASAKAGRVVARNPFADLGIARGPGNRHKTPPSEEIVWALVKHARDLSSPFFAAWLQVAAFTGMRPGELDALRWSAVDLDAGLIRVGEQWSSASRTFTTGACQAG